jgi:alanyl-tRNA synthetase
MTSQQIRQQFLDFFASKGHRIVPSAPMVVKDDPTLMFTNAGMNQFKDLFLGNREPQHRRIADTQKCLRVSGKHNDLEEVGVDTYHHTMFEMLGNWSFGDYFKNDAIDWAWELLTEVYGLPKDRLYATVFGGDATEKLELDTEAEALWAKHMPRERILHGSKKDNFWEMGDSGPCGPCTEIHIDLRSDAERSTVPGRELVNMSHPQVVEIWNLVFIQFNRKADGSLEPLADKHVDTGMGFERLCMAMQGKTSNYDTDVFTPLISAIGEMSGRTYGATMEKQDIAMRVIADHVRAVSFAITDGQLPSNTGAGYVIRRILRRAVRYGFSFLGRSEPFIYRLVDVLALQMGPFFPEIIAQKDLVTKVIQEEEAAFLRTLEKGIERFNVYADAMKGTVVDGRFAFELYDTFGFPIDLTELMARERNLTVDLKGFDEGLAEQKKRSRAATATENSDWVMVNDLPWGGFIGYDALDAPVQIVRYRMVRGKGKEFYQIVLNTSPFYAESGGQVGDTGTLEASGEVLPILDTKKENDLWIHVADRLPKDPKAHFTAKVNRDARARTAANHSATHLLHAVLRQVLGTHVEQKGSLVGPDYLRFDFSHFSKVTEDQIALIESMVNERIRENISLDERRNVPISEAKALGAMALFGEKYGDHVRVITFNPGFSIELCGGTHVQATGNIGLIKITGEGSVAAGIRRIEAVTGAKALEHLAQAERVLNEVNGLLKAKDPVRAIDQLLAQNKDLQQRLDALNARAAVALRDELRANAIVHNGVRLVAARIGLDDANAIKNLCYELNRSGDTVTLLAAESGGKPTLHLAISESLVSARCLDAGKLVRELAKEIRGGGGGQPFYATAGGTDPSGIDRALSRIKEMI